MNNDKQFIEFEEEVDFILTECNKKGVSINRDTIELIINLYLKFLELKGIVTPLKKEQYIRFHNKIPINLI